MSAPPLCLIGHTGMLGRAFAELFERRGLRHAAFDYPELDLARPETLSTAVVPGVQTVINCAAYTNVDGAEEEEALATQVNGAGVGELAERCRAVGATLLHFSTDYVFNGQATKPYPVDHPIDPINAYGRSKAAGEAAVRQVGCDHLIARTSWLYAPWGNNFVLTMLRLGRERDSIRVVNDQRGRPTSAQYLAERSLALLEAGARGTFHVTDGGETSWHGFATEIMRLSGSRCRVSPCTSEEFPRPAARPAFSVLDLSASEAAIGASAPWKRNLAEVVSACVAEKAQAVAQP